MLDAVEVGENDSDIDHIVIGPPGAPSRPRPFRIRRRPRARDAVGRPQERRSRQPTVRKDEVMRDDPGGRVSPLLRIRETHRDLVGCPVPRLVLISTSAKARGAVLGLARHLTDRRVHLDRHRLGGRPGTASPATADRLGDHLVELADVTEGERPQEGAPRGGGHDTEWQHRLGRG